MLDLTGGDAAALAEVRAALDRIAAQDDPDLASALALACHRDQLTDRNSHIPVALPAVWAALGQPTRAEALATSITEPALAGAGPGAGRGGAGRGRAAPAGRDRRRAGRGHRPLHHRPGLAGRRPGAVAGALAEAGQHQHAATVAEQAGAARSITDPDWQAALP